MGQARLPRPRRCVHAHRLRADPPQLRAPHSFWLDDFLIFNLLVNRPLGAFLTMHWAGHLVVVRNAFFFAMYALAGLNPVPYYAVVLALHVLNVALLFGIVYRVTRSAPWASLAATAWGISPMHEGALGWLAASGHILVATALLAVLYDLLRTEGRIGAWRAGCWALAFLIAAQSFGTGLALAIVAPPLLVWLAWTRLTPAALAVLLAVPALTAVMYGTDYHEFTGLLSSSIVARANMLLHLLVIGAVNLLRGLAYEPAPTDYTAPATFVKNLPPDRLDWWMYGAAVGVAALWLVAIWRSSGTARRLLVVFAALALADYGVIAVGRAFFLEAFRQPVTMQAMQMRYHYSATALLAVGTAIATAALLGAHLQRAAPVALVGWLAVSTVLYARSGWQMVHYDAERSAAERMLARIDAAIRATPAGLPVVTYNERFPNAFISGAASLYVMRHKDGPPVYFVDRRAPTVYRDFPGSRLAEAVLPVPSMPLACGPRFTLKSEARPPQ